MVWRATARDWNKSFTNIKHRTQGAVGWEGLVSILTFPHQVGSSPRSYGPIYFCNGPNTCLNCDKEWKKPVWYVTIHFQYQRAFSSPEPSGGLSTRTRRLRGYRIEVLDFRTSGQFRIKSKLGDSLLKALNHVNWILDRARLKNKLIGRAGT